MVKLLHGADLHLDSAYGGLSPEESARRRAMQRQLPQQLVELCRQRECQLLLLAGDVLDGARVRPETLEAMVRAFGSWEGQVFLSPGNHDPYTAGSPWVTVTWPENVHIFTGAQSVCALPELRCRIWGAGFRGPEAAHLLQPIPAAADGWTEIGLFHGDAMTDGPYNTISQEEIRASGLDYLALGHIHKAFAPRKLGRTWYGWPGSAAARGFDETGPRQVFLVELDRERFHCEPVVLPGLRYESLEVPAGENPLEALQAALPQPDRDLACRVTFTGEAEPFDPSPWQAQLAPGYGALELRDRTVPRRDLWAGSGESTLRGLALEELRQSGDSLGARYLLAALEGGEAPCEF